MFICSELQMGKEGRKESDILYEKRMEVDIFILVHWAKTISGLTCTA